MNAGWGLCGSGRHFQRWKRSAACCRVTYRPSHVMTAVEVLKIGARGFVLKESSGDELLTAFKCFPGRHVPR
jgi:DNA-binding NarL/FixJ family response regulator